MDLSKSTDALIFWAIFIKLNRQNVGIPLGTNCVPLLLVCFCSAMRGFMKSLKKEKRYDLIYAFNSTVRYLDDLLNIDNIHFEHMVHRIYPAVLQFNKAKASDTEAAFLDLNVSIHNDIVSTKIYVKRDDFNFYIVNFPFLDGDVPRRPSYGVYVRSKFSHACDMRSITPCMFVSVLAFYTRLSVLRSLSSTSVCILDLACSLLMLNNLPSKRQLIGNPVSQS